MSASGNFSNLEGPERLLGSRVLEFELTSVLGAGGMSVVYRGRHRLTQQEVAIKVLPPELATHDDLKARFVEEARVLARLEHPNIVGLNNFVETGGRLCLIMSFVEGVTFESQIHQATRVPWQEVARIGVEVCKALEYAHGMSVIHRDIKPSNVLVRSDGAVKVTDFGIARILGGSRLTQTGQTMGTVRYMSPEQVRGQEVDARSDLYSLGCTLFEGAAGVTPFDGDTQFQIMQAHLRKRPPTLRSLGVDVPVAFERVLERALEKDVKRRFQTAEQLRRALEDELAREREGRPAPSRGQRSRVVLGIGAGVLVTGVAVVLMLVRPGGPPSGGAPASPAPLPLAAGSPSTGTAARSGAPRADAVNPKARTGEEAGFLEPHVVPGLILRTDRTFVGDGLRVQAVAKRSPEALRDRYRDLTASLRGFMGASPKLRADADRPIPPLTITLVPQDILDNPKLWPGFAIKPDASYPSRYVEARRTLFVADNAERAELPYAVALHVLATATHLGSEALLQEAERFDAFYKQAR